MILARRRITKEKVEKVNKMKEATAVTKVMIVGYFNYG